MLPAISLWGTCNHIPQFDLNTKTGHASNLKFEAFSISRRIGQCADDQRSLTVRFDRMLLTMKKCQHKNSFQLIVGDP